MHVRISQHYSFQNQRSHSVSRHQRSGSVTTASQTSPTGSYQSIKESCWKTLFFYNSKFVWPKPKRAGGVYKNLNQDLVEITVCIQLPGKTEQNQRQVDMSIFAVLDAITYRAKEGRSMLVKHLNVKTLNMKADSFLCPAFDLWWGMTSSNTLKQRHQTSKNICYSV